jgi:hypothetical protein
MMQPTYLPHGQMMHLLTPSADQQAAAAVVAAAAAAAAAGQQVCKQAFLFYCIPDSIKAQGGWGCIYGQKL